jgi:hypothetical protein
MSVHPTTTTEEIEMVATVLKLWLIITLWALDYTYNKTQMSLYTTMQNHLKMI